MVVRTAGKRVVIKAAYLVSYSVGWMEFEMEILVAAMKGQH